MQVSDDAREVLFAFKTVGYLEFVLQPRVALCVSSGLVGAALPIVADLALRTRSALVGCGLLQQLLEQ